MTVEFADGFEDWTSISGEYQNVIGSPTVSAGVGRRGGSALVLNGAMAVGRSLVTPRTEIFASIALYPTDSGSASTIFMGFYSGATAQISLVLNASNTIEVRRGAESGTLLGSSSAGAMPTAQYSHAIVRVVVSDTVGVVQIRLNGSDTPAVNLTGVDTNNGAAAVSVSEIRLGARAGGAARVGRYDDFVINNTDGSIANSWIGDTRVDSYFQNSNGDSSQFVGSDGNSTDNYQLVGGAAPNGTDYVQSSTVNDEDLYGFQDMIHTPTTIFGVLVAASALKDDAGSRSFRTLAKSGGTKVDNGADFVLSTSRTRYLGAFETDPNTSVAWTKSGLSAAQFGEKVTV